MPETSPARSATGDRLTTRVRSADPLAGTPTETGGTDTEDGPADGSEKSQDGFWTEPADEGAGAGSAGDAETTADSDRDAGEQGRSGDDELSPGWTGLAPEESGPKRSTDAETAGEARQGAKEGDDAVDFAADVDLPAEDEEESDDDRRNDRG
jgi:hypothetical protein